MSELLRSIESLICREDGVSMLGLKQLSQEDVDALPEGAEVYIKWEGGNGPWLYRVIKRRGMSAVDTCYKDVIQNVGPGRFNNRVWLPA